MKSSILKDLLDMGRQAERKFVDELSDEERTETSTYEKWSAKDILAHNSYWRKYHAENMLKVLAGKTLSRQHDSEHANEGVYAQYRDQPWEAVEALFNASYERLQEALGLLGEDGLMRVHFFPWQEGHPLWRFVAGNIFTHPIAHLAEWYIKKGNAACAAELYQEMTDLSSGLDDSPDWQGTIRYNLACSYSILGEKEKAIKMLGEALQMNPALAEWSKQDPDFEPIREEAGYKALYT